MKPALAGHEDRSHDLSAGDVHRTGAHEPVARDARRLRAGDRHSGRVSVRLADGPDQHDGDSPVAGRRRPRAALYRAPRSTRWSSPGWSSRWAKSSTTRSSTSRTFCGGCGSTAKSAQPQSAFQVVLAASLEVRIGRGLRQPDRDAGFRAGPVSRRAVGVVLPAAGDRLHPGDSGVAAGRPDGHAGPVADAAAQRRRTSATRRLSPASSKRSMAGSCRSFCTGPSSRWRFWP